MKLAKSREYPIFFLCFIFALLVFILDYKAAINPIKRISEGIVLPIKSSLFNFRAKGLDFFSPQLTQKDQQIESLKEQNANLIAQITELKSVQEENNQMRKLLGTNIPSAWKFTPAKVVGKIADTISISSDSSTKLQEIVILPRDENSTAQVSQFGVYVGKISQTTGSLSKVLLATSTDSKISVIVRAKDSFAQESTGILVGRGGRVLLDQIVATENVNIGDWVVTSSTTPDSNSQEQLLVGKINKVISSNNQTFKQAEVELTFIPEKLDVVFVVTKK